MYDILPLKVGQCMCPAELNCLLHDWDKKVRFFYYFWLIRGHGKTVLVDTGFDLEYAHRFMGDMQQKPSERPLTILKKLGVAPTDIDYVIITHAHFDHLSPLLNEYSRAKIVIQKRELECGIKPPHAWFVQFNDGDVVRSLRKENAHRTIVVDGDKSILPGLKVFWTGGHSPGHQSVLVSTRQGPTVLCGDVAFTYKNLQQDIPIGLSTSVEESLLSMRKIRKLGKVLLPGHDPLVMRYVKTK